MERVDQPAQDIDAAVSELERRTDRDEPRPVGPIYHYTSPAGALGIVRDRAIWATHYRHLNDRQELVAGEELVRRVALSLQETLTGWQRTVLEAFVKIYLEHSFTKATECYIASFSEDPNLLSQWRAYGQVCVGVSITQTPQVDGSPFDRALVRCVYDSVQLEHDVRSRLATILHEAEQLGQGRPWLGDGGYVRKVLVMLLRRAAEHSARVKHEGYKDEKEWRLIVVPTQRDAATCVPCFRATARDIVPYVPTPLDVQEIGLGPELEQDLVEDGFRRLVDAVGANVQYSRSHIPHRG